MNIYDEAIENAKCYKVVNEILFDGKDKYRHDNYANQIIQALERAKRVEELLGLYRNLSMETNVFERSKYWERINKIELEELK